MSQPEIEAKTQSIANAAFNKNGDIDLSIDFVREEESAQVPLSKQQS